MADSQRRSLDYKILPATEADCVAIASIEATSNCLASKTKPENNLSRVLFGTSSDVSPRAKDLLDKLQNDKSMQMSKVVISDANGEEKIIALSIWHYYPEPKEIEDWKDIEWPPTAHGDGCNSYIRSAVAMRKKHMSGKIFGRKWLLNLLI